jgi:hypothetical protein
MTNTTMYFFKSLSYNRPCMSLIYCFFSGILFSTLLTYSQCVLVLDPSDAPRQLATSFAKGATMQCAEALKKRLEEQYPVQVSITRTPGLKTTHENHAQMSNRLGAHLYIHLSFFQETELKPRFFMYYYANGSEITHIPNTQLKWCPYEWAHHAAHKQTTALANTFYTRLTTTAQIQYRLMAPVGIPCAPLLGITAPALMIEIGLHAAHTWQTCIEPLVKALEPLITEITV